MFKKHKKLLVKFSIQTVTTVTFTSFAPFNNVTLTFSRINQVGKLYFGQVTIVNHTDFEKLLLQISLLQ